MIRKFLFLLLPFSLCAQLSDIKNYYHDEGLHCKAVYNLGQDKDGIIWIGTDNGLYSFDGKTFTPYDGSSTLKDTEILCNISIDDEIFVITLNKKSAYLKDGEFITKKENPALGKIIFNNTASMSYDAITEKIALSNNDPHKQLYIYKKGVVEPITLNDPSRVIKYHNDIVYFFNKKNEIFKLALKNHVYTKMYIEYIPNKEIQNIFFGKNYATIIFENEVYFYKIENDSSLLFLHKLAISKTVRTVHFNPNGDLWLIHSNGGITRYDIFSKRKMEIFNDYIINDFFTDKNKNIWFSTRNHGLFFWNKFKFQNFLKKNRRNTEGKNILSIDGYKDTIYYGLNILKAGVINPTELKEFPIENSDKLKGIISTYISKDKLFFATNTDIYVYNYNLKPIEKVSGLGSLKKISDFDENHIIVATSCSSLLVNKETFQFTEFFPERSYDAVPIDNKHAFICSGQGLFRVNIANHSNTQLISDYIFFSGSKASDNYYAFATNAGGIFTLHNGEQQQLTKDDGLLSNSITKVLFETPHVLWAIGNRGINRIVFKNSYKTYTIDTFTEADGIPLATLNDFYLYDGFMYLATSKGLEVLNTNDLLKQKQQEKNTKLVLNYIHYRDTTFNRTDIEIPYSKSSIDISVSYPDYNSYGNTKLKYKLINQENYSHTEASNIILSSLQPGKHELEIYGLNSSNTLSQEKLIIRINVIPMFWQTWWFKMLTFALLTALVYSILIGIYIRRKKRNQEKIQTKKKLTELEVEVMKSQMNPHFISNCLNSIKLLNYKKDYTNSQLYIDRFNRMLRFNLAYSNNTFVTIKEEISYLNDYLELEKLRFKELFDYEIIPVNQKIENYKIPSFLIQPFVENAIKHAFVETPLQKGNIYIQFKIYDDKTIEITIQDDGIGIESLSNSDPKQQSKGIDLIHKRVALYRQIFNVFITLSIVDLSKYDQKGTKVQLKINHTHAI